MSVQSTPSSTELTPSQKRMDFLIEGEGTSATKILLLTHGSIRTPATKAECAMWLRLGELDTTIARQANSARMGMDAAHAVGRDQLMRGLRLEAENSPSAVNSEKAANAFLTDENERLSRRVEELQEEVANLRCELIEANSRT